MFYKYGHIFTHIFLSRFVLTPAYAVVRFIIAAFAIASVACVCLVCHGIGLGRN